MKVKFVPQNIEVEVTSSKSLLQIATENNIEIKSICKGVPSCAECRVRIVDGERNILPPTKAEIGLIGSSYYIDGRRLSCQVRCFGNVTVDLTEQVERAEVQNKKVRGFKSQRTIESKAIQDTFILTDHGPSEKAEVDAGEANRGDTARTTPQDKNSGHQRGQGNQGSQGNRGNRPSGNSNSNQGKGGDSNQKNSNHRSRPNKGKN